MECQIYRLQKINGKSNDRTSVFEFAILAEEGVVAGAVGASDM